MSSSKHLKSPAGAVHVRGNNVDQASRVMKKRLQREGVFRQMKEGRFYRSKGEKARDAAKKSAKRAFKKTVNNFARDHMITKAEARKILSKNGRSPR